MNVPKDIPLAVWIRQLYKENKIILFYKSKEWMELRQEVLNDYHYECQVCLSKGRYKRADCVHHINEVNDRPDLALSRYYIDKDGNEQDNLMPLCNQCHNAIHDKLYVWQRKDKFTNKEQW